MFLDRRQCELAPFALGPNLRPAQLHNEWVGVARPPRSQMDARIEAMFAASEERHRRRRRRSRRWYGIVEALFWISMILSVCVVFGWAGSLMFA